MESIDINELEEFLPLSIVKKVPIITEQLMATLICIDKETKTAPHIHQEIDELQYIVKGSGKITVGKISKELNTGMLILVPRSNPHFFSTSKEQLIVISISTLPENEVEPEKAPFVFKSVDG